ncbi:ribonuclease E activity regulator RraA [Actimicrobium sp. CCI2.3]|uniref:ribonuclease E activity regulator RraA n=1 Tax=Actimicrobium sp. CCI2.3 TaxID=3048616 RepID=UPI002AB4E825|nr:ribonuclease E activity regulator RraA [Actimicrobium sp. CCI2.3]MDY7574243.1 ribonuclease E activity regulator RraA [Actimicrobium sp. CCI2.3]MEB0022757.1 ribonuclease E activity regulator RraA [Actimicrobium sp. CCI2.3]
MRFSSCDLCDAHEDLLVLGTLQVLPPVFQSYGQSRAFCGPAVTLKVFEDNVLVRAALEQPGQGRVLVVDGGGSLRCGMVGGNLAKLAETNRWSGIIVFGCVRDAEELNACGIGLRALAVHPRRSARKGVGETGVNATIAGVMVRPGDWIYADADGVLVSQERLS